MMTAATFYGYGLGLRPCYVDNILQEDPAVDWFEVLTENYLVPGGKPLSVLSRIRERYPVAMHGVSLSIGSSDPLNRSYLNRVKALADQIDPMWISDHLCWTGVDNINLHDLLPLPYTEEAVHHVSARIRMVQDILGRQILIENVSSYASYTDSMMTEWEFLSQIADESDCLLLFDVNNVYVSSRNHGFDVMDFVRGVPQSRVRQFHLAGHSDYGDYVIDTHDQPVRSEVWDLYRACVQHFGPVSAMIERDDNYPPFEELMAEVATMRAIGDEPRMVAA